MTTYRQRPDGRGSNVPITGVVVPLGGPGGQRDRYRVEVPGRVLRMWSLLNAVDEELHQVTLPPEALPGLQRLLEAVHGELERSVSPALAGELRRLTPPGQAPRGADELRLECVSLLGWTGGLVIGMLGQLEAARLRQYQATSTASDTAKGRPLGQVLCGKRRKHLPDGAEDREVAMAGVEVKLRARYRRGV